MMFALDFVKNKILKFSKKMRLNTIEQGLNKQKYLFLKKQNKNRFFYLENSI